MEKTRREDRSCNFWADEEGFCGGEGCCSVQCSSRGWLEVRCGCGKGWMWRGGRCVGVYLGGGGGGGRGSFREVGGNYVQSKILEMTF